MGSVTSSSVNLLAKFEIYYLPEVSHIPLPSELEPA